VLSRNNRTADAGRYLDKAIDIFRDLGPTGISHLRSALDKRITNANQQNDADRMESATREILSLYAPGSGEAVAARSLLANAQDRKAKRPEADALRAEAVAIETKRFGANSAEVMHTRLNGLYWLRASGRVAEAQASAMTAWRWPRQSTQ
jgi:hypothetical protein